LAEALDRLGVTGVEPEVSVPERTEHGDFSSNIAFALKSRLGCPPHQLAERILAHLDQGPFSKAEVAGAGFINLFLKPEEIRRALQAILAAGEHFGESGLGRGQRVQVEYGSANPTGPLHLGFGRNVVLGDAIANLLAANGYTVEREYYVNDTGSQVEKFAASLYYFYVQALGREPPFPFPEEGYRGEYVREWARELAAAEGERLLRLPQERALEETKRLGLERVLRTVRADLEKLGIDYDRWFFDSELFIDRDGGPLFAQVMELLRAKGYLKDEAGAVWFKATALGAEKDEVLIRSTGRPGYFASDVAYHYNKFVERGFDRVIDVWGADHQGHVPRMKAMMRAFGLDPERLSILIYQLVTLKRGGEEVRLSKRSGEFVTLRELLDEVGPDAVRYFLLSRSPDAHLEFDLELAKEQSKENPVFYIQYAHTRIAGIFRELRGKPPRWAEVDLEPLQQPEELELIKHLDEFPEVVRDAALHFAPHLLANYAYGLAGLFHIFYDRYRVLDEAPPLARARLALCRATQLVLRKALGLMGVSAPERM
jgi:arginyl-tRNA synthetase